MQLDDLMIDKKSFQVEGLLSSLASCIDVKLTHNELYSLMKHFFNLYENKYGSLENIEDITSKISKGNNYISRIKINDIILRNPKYKLLDEYTGTFNLEHAREREEIDFFALGHPLINTIIDFCKDDTFEGSYTILKLKRQILPKSLVFESINQSELYLFIFTIKFQGYIIENQILPVIVDIYGNEVVGMADFILNIDNYDKIFQFNDDVKNINLNIDLFNPIQQKAKDIVKSKTSMWKREVRNLNDKIFTLERNKKEKIYAYKRRVLNLKVETLKQRLERKENKKPTKRQLQNINNITDEKRKTERLKDIQKLEEDIKFIKRDLKVAEKKLDDLSFEHEDMKNEMIRRNLAKFYTNLNSFALIRIVD